MSLSWICACEQAPAPATTSPHIATQRKNIFRGKNNVTLRFTKKAAHCDNRFFSPKGDVFTTMKAEFWNKTVLGFGTVQELALKHKAERTGRWAEGHSNHEWCFYCFCFHQIKSRKLNLYIINEQNYRYYPYSFPAFSFSHSFISSFFSNP